MNSRINWNRSAQLVVVLLCALTLKLCYSTASPNQLRWILAPTTTLVELVSRTSFEFESHEGYIASDRSFIIGGSCAGVNFLMISFLVLSLRTLWRARNLSWRFLPAVAVSAYLATLVANTVRIAIALQMHRHPPVINWLSPNELHRLEGIFVYFGFLLLLFAVSEKTDMEQASSANNRRSLFGQSLLPLAIYYAITLGIPLANGASREGNDFWEHSLFVLLTPWLLILPLAAFRLFRSARAATQTPPIL